MKAGWTCMYFAASVQKGTHVIAEDIKAVPLSTFLQRRGL